MPREKPVSLGKTVQEDHLPFPVVHYPNHYGTFFAFSESNSSSVSLCACSEDAVHNLLRLKEARPTPNNTDPLRTATLDNWFFPSVVADLSLESESAIPDQIQFVQGLCHRCNLVTPELRYCHEMYGTEFIQHYGWYVNQAYLRLGIMPMSLQYLEDVCPQEYQDLINHANKINAQFRAEEERLQEIASGPARPDISSDEVTYWRNVRYEDAEEMIALRRDSVRATRAVTKEIENIVREEFGFKKVGEAWVNETLLFQLVSRIFPDLEVLRHHRPDWLDGLELDIYVPSMDLALEYQGQQHFHPIDAWGGEDALKELQKRDERKLQICDSKGIDLIAIHYKEPLTLNHIRTRIGNKGIEVP